MGVPRPPTTPAPASSDLVGAIRESRLMSDRRLDGIRRLVASGDYPAEPAPLADILVRDRLLTAFQARRLLRGRGRDLTVGRYVLLDPLGHGAMGRVYRAWHRMMGRVVALKVLHPSLASGGDSAARFRREMLLAGRLDHPNVVRALDADRIGPVAFLAMEYLLGLTLKDLLTLRGPLPPADVVHYAAQAADGLAHAHDRGVLHRDIKPSNLLLTADRRVKVLDFGLGRLLASERGDASLTTAGMIIGTPHYISPEQARMSEIDGRSDLYALGCTMYHLISGRLPFPGESSMDCLVRRIVEPPAPIAAVVPGLPARLVEVVDRLLARNPADRFQAAGDLAEALRGMLRRKVAVAGPGTASVVAAAPADAGPATPVLPGIASPDRSGEACANADRPLSVVADSAPAPLAPSRGRDPGRPG